MWNLSLFSYQLCVCIETSFPGFTLTQYIKKKIGDYIFIIRLKSIILFYFMYLYFVILLVGWCAMDFFFKCEKCPVAHKRLEITALIYFNIIPTSSALQRRESLRFFFFFFRQSVKLRGSQCKVLWMRFCF